jgi:ArsR family transcriptional regulator, arsenate/arsenite/antimonite-responsive transcriptional repressor
LIFANVLTLVNVLAQDVGQEVVMSQEPVAITPDCCPTVAGAPLDDADATALAQGFAALADPVRLRLLSMIASEDEVCSCNVLEPLGKSQPTVSHHTKTLAEAGLIVGEKRGRWVYWRVVPERLADLQRALAPVGVTTG